MVFKDPFEGMVASLKMMVNLNSLAFMGRAQALTKQSAALLLLPDTPPPSLRDRSCYCCCRGRVASATAAKP